MIRYSLRCAKGHDFDGWFRSSDAFDTMRGAGQVTCAHCGSADVQKSLMAPSVPTKRAPLTTPTNDAEKALNDLRRHVEENSDYVGMSFAQTARDMHDGTTPARAIHGEATPEQARQLIADGVPVAPLPFVPRQKAN
ncbi:DUF1178 family protein [Paracoccus sp. (in: a-proteobacteria)]|uniref:DUF1178 family protein n=1 Tax=Paracoccus sp. TaxID=267 RepID=UPI0026DFB131|nr:DUF1178 family protein [Paracoccus sp. (in: a-proteobacteria)]MDO5648048.1 DUF1178 family protein [Paracoccus sp. (in: a-proteobacteria)]